MGMGHNEHLFDEQAILRESPSGVSRLCAGIDF